MSSRAFGACGAFSSLRVAFPAPALDAGALDRVGWLSSRVEMENPIQELVTRALAGDRPAMRQLFAQVICPVIERRLGHRLAVAGAARATLRDHVQEVVVHLLERDLAVLRRWDPARGAIEPFIAKVAENHMISRLRKRPPPVPSEQLDEEVSPSQSPEQDASFSRLVVRLLREMNDNDAALFRAIYLEELSPDEVATRLGISREAAHKRIQRLRARLGEMLSTPDTATT